MYRMNENINSINYNPKRVKVIVYNAKEGTSYYDFKVIDEEKIKEMKERGDLIEIKEYNEIHFPDLIGSHRHTFDMFNRGLGEKVYLQIIK